MDVRSTADVKYVAVNVPMDDLDGNRMTQEDLDR